MTIKAFQQAETGQVFWSSESLEEPKGVTLLEKLSHSGVCSGNQVIHHERLHLTKLEAWRHIEWRCNIWLQNAQVNIKDLESAKEAAICK